MFFFQLELLDLDSCRTCSCHSKGCIASGVHPFFTRFLMVTHVEFHFVACTLQPAVHRGGLLIHGQECLDATLQDVFVDSKNIIQCRVGLAHVAILQNPSSGDFLEVC